MYFNPTAADFKPTRRSENVHAIILIEMPPKMKREESLNGIKYFESHEFRARYSNLANPDEGSWNLNDNT